MHWKMMQGCIGSVKNSGKVDLGGFWIKKSISAFKI